MRTIPDTIDLIKKKLKPFRPINILDSFYSLCEHYGGKIGNYGWQKRWCNREKGTGYRNNR